MIYYDLIMGWNVCVFGLGGALLAFWLYAMIGAPQCSVVLDGGAFVSVGTASRTGHVPMVWRNSSLVRKWLAWSALRNRRWWEKEIGRTVPRLSRSGSGLFFFPKERSPLAGVLPPSRWSTLLNMKPPTSVKDMAVEDFLDLWSTAKEEKIAYSERLPDRMMPLFAPLEPFLVNVSSSLSIHLWMASAGSRTFAHHDFSHNVFVQLAGVKKFVLLAPDAVPAVKLFPWTHPHATKVMDATGIDDHPQRYEVVLDEGDILFIPPYFIHDVYSVTSSMSVAIWSSSRDQGAADSLLQLGVPGPDMRTLFYWISALLIHVDHDGRPANEFVDSVLRRYLEWPELAVDIHPGCPTPESPIGRYARARLFVESALLDRAIGHVREISPQNRPLLMGNYLEMVALQFCGGKAERIPTWLNCLAQWLK